MTALTTQNSRSLRSQFRINVVSNIFYYAASVLLSLWFVPYLMRHIGVESYGMVPLISSITAYLALVTLSLNSSYGRHFALELAKGNYQEANALFNTALLTTAMLLGVATIAAFGFAPFLGKVFTLPAGREGEVLVLYWCAVAAFACSTLEANFGVSMWALNRFDLRNIVTFLGRLSHVGLVVLLFRLTSQPRLWHVGVGMLLAACVTLVCSTAIWRRLTPQISVNPSLCNPGDARRLLGTSIWLVTNQVGSMLFLNIDLFVVNILFGAEMTGRYGALLQISAVLRTVAGLLSGVLTPTVIQKHACDDNAGITAIMRRSVRYLGLLFALPVGLICGFARPFLGVWLGPQFIELAPLLVLLTAHLCVNLAVLPLFPVHLALNKVRLPGIVTLISGALNAVLAVVLASYSSLGALGVALAGAVMLTAKNVLFTPIYGAHIQRVPWWTYLQPLGATVVAAAAVGLAGYHLSAALDIRTSMGLALWMSVVGVLYGVLVYRFILRQEDRSFLMRMVGI